MIITICSSDSMVIEQSDQAIAKTDMLSNNYTETIAAEVSGIQKIFKTEFINVLKN